jgi:hypothetical protein
VKQLVLSQLFFRKNTFVTNARFERMNRRVTGEKQSRPCPGIHNTFLTGVVQGFVLLLTCVIVLAYFTWSEKLAVSWLKMEVLWDY